MALGVSSVRARSDVAARPGAPVALRMVEKLGIASFQA
jgi:hypothetical protein